MAPRIHIDDSNEFSGKIIEGFVCPHCGHLSSHALQEPSKEIKYHPFVVTKEGNQERRERSDWIFRKHLVYRCPGCYQDTYFLIESFRSQDSPVTIILHQYPVATAASNPSVPKEVRSASWEAEQCLAVRAYNACGVMTRRAMHAICQDKSAQGTDLYQQLKYLKDNHLITPDLWEWAEELRVIGRSGAHPEWQEVTKDDADYAVKFLREIIRYVYRNPAERAAKKLKESKVKKGA